MEWDQVGFDQEFLELAEKYKMRYSFRQVHRPHCITRSGGKPCNCEARYEYVLYRQDREDAEAVRSVLGGGR